MQVRYSKSGFTLVELLVVISIIGMLMALLLPAVQAARETARGNTCRNNMRNLAQAAVQYEGAKNFFPGIQEIAAPTSDPTDPVSRPLIYNLAGYLERNDIVEAYSRDNTAYADRLLDTLPPIYMAILICPSDPQPSIVGNFAPTAYVFNGGIPNDVTDWDNTYMNDGMVAYNQIRSNAPDPADSLLAINYNTSAAHATAHDGLTQTLLVSENLDAGYWNSYPEESLCFTWNDISTANVANYKPNARNRGQGGSFTGVAADGEYEYAKPSSNHPRVFNATFADTHVKTISEDISYLVYAQLCTPWGARAYPVALSSGNPLAGLRAHVLDESEY